MGKRSPLRLNVMYKICVILTALHLISPVESARILGVFPFASKSHYILSSSLMRGLAEAGHNVTIVSPYEENKPSKAGSYKEVVLTGFLDEFEKLLVTMNLFEIKNQSMISGMRMISKMFTETLDDMFNHENVQQLLRSDEKFDAVIVEQFFNDATKIFGHIYGAPVIAVSPVGATPWVNDMVGNPSPLSYIPQMNSGISPPLSFTDRLQNSIIYTISKILEDLFYFRGQQNILKKNFPNAPDIYDLYYNVSLVLLNSHESLHQPVPSVPNMIQIGGYHVKPPSKLPKDLQDFLDNAKEGVVYFSMGSNLKSRDLPADKRDAFLQAFRKLKQKVLWKWEEKELPGKPANVKIEKWLPQQDILAHPNVKLFITHGGLLSTTETVYHGVPILAIPVFGDQHENAGKAVLSGYALSLPYEDPSFSEEKLSQMLHELLNDNKYTENVKKRSRVFHDRPMKPMDTAVYWVEYVIRHKGAPHLKVAGATLPWYIYHSIDVIAFLVVIIALALYILHTITRKICRNICKGTRKTKKD